MTPIDFFLVAGASIYCVDKIGVAVLVAVSPSIEQADWLATGMASHHGVEVRKKTDDSAMYVRLDRSA